LSGLRAEGRGGVPADPVEAYAWASIAASRNVQGAAAARDKLGAGLSEAQIAEAKSRAEKLVPQPAR
jgi:TPR repeat protein